tara:strand:+ start:302 stop:856 length:555 start_codon:yes stop_codon:yes gene_type:complete
METKERKKSTFSAISINRIVAERFRQYSKKVSPSHTETLETIMDFFEGAKISPYDKHLMDYMRYNNVINKRLDYLMEVLRAWEKNSPIHRIHDQLKKLFDQAEIEEEEEKEKLVLEKIKYKRFSKPANTVSNYKYELLVDKLEKEQRQRRKLLDKFKLMKSSFGKQYYRVDISSNEFELMRRSL